MNERIQNLIEQATKVIEPNDPDYRQEIFDKRLFAQLIAQECARLAMTQHCSTSPDDYDEMEPYEQGCDDAASNISGMIRRTFGVEE